jgi:hypothetical protein
MPHRAYLLTVEVEVLGKLEEARPSASGVAEVFRPSLEGKRVTQLQTRLLLPT